MKHAIRWVGLVLLGSAPLFADPATRPATQEAVIPATGPAVALAPATQPAMQPIGQPSVASVLAAMDAAYAKLSTAEFDGHITGEFEVDGQRQKYDQPFTSRFAAPNKFRHDAGGDILLGSTGTSVYAFLSGRDEYQTFDAPKARAASGDWPESVVKILFEQNPSLLLAISKSASAELKELSKQITLEPPAVIDGVACDTLRFDISANQEMITMLVDPQTHLLRQVRYDQRKSLQTQGAMGVKQALVTVDYKHSSTNTPVDANQFAWSAPIGAVQASSASVAMASASDGLSDDQRALIGKTAPDFTLPGLDDVPVQLSLQKGSVVVLDFWATWCGPCVASLPHLDSLYKQQGPNGLKVYALNQREKKPWVSNFVQKKGWSIPVLLDSDGAVATVYKVTGIPQTVIVGKDGIVKQAFIGSGHEKEIAAEVAKEMR